MRPVPKFYRMHFGFGVPYPTSLQHLTEDGKHHGYDYLTPIGTAGCAGVDGILNNKGYLRGFGQSIIVKFWTGSLWWKKEYRIILAHLYKITTDKMIGSKISKSELLYLTGDSGMAKGHPHLHIEVQLRTKNGWVAVDPKFAVGV